MLILDLDGEFELECNASKIRLEVVLRQGGKPIAYISKSLTKEERNYSITEREFLSALWAMGKFEFYLIGKDFKLITDHKAIEAVKNKNDFGSSRIQRWINRISKFPFNVEYWPGNKLIQADALNKALKTIKNTSD